MTWNRVSVVVGTRQAAPLGFSRHESRFSGFKIGVDASGQWTDWLEATIRLKHIPAAHNQGLYIRILELTTYPNLRRVIFFVNYGIKASLRF